MIAGSVVIAGSVLTVGFETATGLEMVAGSMMTAAWGWTNEAGYRLWIILVSLLMALDRATCCRN